MSNFKQTVRRIALDALAEWDKGHLYAESIVHNMAQKHQLKKEDRNMLNSIIMHTIRNARTLDAWISRFRDGAVDDTTRHVLRIGLCQLHIMGVSEHAAVNETVNSCRKGIRGLINAVLRESIRQKDSLYEEMKDLGVRYSHPDWLVDRWLQKHGREQTEALLKWNQETAPTIFRLNPLKTDSHQILSDEEHIFSSIPEHPDFYISQGLPPKAWLDDGLIYIQDPVTSESVNMLAPLPGEMVLDTCAAPGGKANQMAAHMQNSGTIICTDSNAKRLPRLLDNLSRLGVSIAQTDTWDWTEPAPKKWHEQFDAILLDVPCSNTGVLRRRVDARWRLSAEQITDLTFIQVAIIKNASACLKPGGRMVYSTCSIDDEENTLLIQRILKEDPSLELKKEKQVYPFSHGTDGAYAALLVKK